MPLYEYRCKKCGEHIERIRKFSDPPLTKCPECGGKLEQQLSSPAFQFKGTGWYITDYARKSSSPGKEKGDGAGAGKDDKKPAETSGKTSGNENSKSKEPATSSKSQPVKPKS